MKEHFKIKYRGEKIIKVGFLEDEPAILAAVGAKISQTPFENLKKEFQNKMPDISYLKEL